MAKMRGRQDNAHGTPHARGHSKGGGKNQGRVRGLKFKGARKGKGG